MHVLLYVSNTDSITQGIVVGTDPYSFRLSKHRHCIIFCIYIYMYYLGFATPPLTR
jgi:hypothetical protein